MGSLPRRCLGRCGRLVPAGRSRCDACQAAMAPRVDPRRGTNWWRIRRAVIAAHPMCAFPGCLAQAAEVDHVLPLADGGSVDGGTHGLQPLCKRHHLDAAADRRAAVAHGRPYKPQGPVFVWADRPMLLTARPQAQTSSPPDAGAGEDAPLIA